ncbi:MAG: RHS repeat-associated core domain-containing protein [Verrucomicrobia bacterium]|nr:RHS repeat-associated core domain-containing protein [Verrucomicrobiota bacterium]
MNSVLSLAGMSTCIVNDRNQATTVAGYTQSYNALGNRTQEMTGTTTSIDYLYDAENQLTSAASDTYSTPDAARWKMEFVYDGRGRMRIRRDFAWTAGAWSLSAEQRYVYDGMLLLQQRSSGNLPQVSYTRGLDLSGSVDGAGGIGGLLARSTHATTSPYAVNSSAYYHADGNGNITYLLRSDAAASASYKYDPFGRTLSSSGTLAAANVLRFSSKPILLSSYGNWGDYYYGFRLYDPESQRWLNRDPIGEWGGMNLYRIAGNSPQTKVDLLGLAWYDFVPVIGTIAGCFNPAPGEDPGDFAFVSSPTCKECKEDSDGAIARCQNAVNQAATKYVGRLVAPGVVKFGIDAVVAGLGAITVVGTPIAFGAAIDGLVGAGCTINTGFNIYDAAKSAKEKYCQCPKSRTEQ